MVVAVDAIVYDLFVDITIESVDVGVVLIYYVYRV